MRISDLHRRIRVQESVNADPYALPEEDPTDRLDWLKQRQTHSEQQYLLVKRKRARLLKKLEDTYNLSAMDPSWDSVTRNDPDRPLFDKLTQQRAYFHQAYTVLDTAIKAAKAAQTRQRGKAMTSRPTDSSVTVPKPPKLFNINGAVLTNPYYTPHVTKWWDSNASEPSTRHATLADQWPWMQGKHDQFLKKQIALLLPILDKHDMTLFAYGTQPVDKSKPDARSDVMFATADGSVVWDLTKHENRLYIRNMPRKSTTPNALRGKSVAEQDQLLANAKKP